MDKFTVYHEQFYSFMEVEHRIVLAKPIIKHLRQDNAVDSKEVHLVACNYRLTSVNAAHLQREQPFDFLKLLDTLGKLTAANHSNLIRILATKTVVHVINTCFRHGYVLNVLKYKIAAGFAAIIPFGDQLPRYLSRDAIRERYGIDEDLHNYLRRLELTIHNYKLQTSVFEKSVKVADTQMKSRFEIKEVGKVIGTGLVVVGANVLDDIVAKIAAPATTALAGVGRVIFTAGTLGVDAVITLAVCVWSASNGGKHIFSYVNRLCDDLTVLTDAFVIEILRR